MSDAETSAYLLMAGGLIWVLVGMFGLRKQRAGNEPAEHTADDENSSDQS